MFDHGLTLPVGGEFCHLLLIFTNSLDPYQARHNVGPDLDQTVRHSDSVLERSFKKKKKF